MMRMLEQVVDIVDYGMGNLRSVQKAFERTGTSSKIISSPDEVLDSQKLILPGVGHFASAMEVLRAKGLFEALNQAVLIRKVPILGICLGMQLMTQFSEEGDARGFGWIRAWTRKFSFAQNTLRIPHIGWNRLAVKKDGSLFKGIKQDDFYYFVHSYYIACDEQDDILAETSYGNTFVSAFQHENIYGCQFHPEKSHEAGLKILKNFGEL